MLNIIINRLKVLGWKRIDFVKYIINKDSMVVLISEKIELQKNTTASSTGDICGNKMVNFTVKHNNARASMYMRQKLKALKGEKYFNIPASEIKGKGRKCM